jgi:hypothetical protein
VFIVRATHGRVGRVCRGDECNQGNADTFHATEISAARSIIPAKNTGMMLAFTRV